MRITQIQDVLRISGNIIDMHDGIHFTKEFYSIEIYKHQLTKNLDISMELTYEIDYDTGREKQKQTLYELQLIADDVIRVCKSTKLEVIEYVIKCINEDKDITEAQCKLDLSEHFI